MPTVTFLIRAEVERVTGPFASTEDIRDSIRDDLESANPDTIYVEDTEYGVEEWEVEDGPDAIPGPDRNPAQWRVVRKTLDRVAAGKARKGDLDRLRTLLPEAFR